MRYGKKQVPCQRRDGEKASNSFVFREEGAGLQQKSRAEFRAGGRPKPRWWFSASGSAGALPISRMPRNTKAPIVSRGLNQALIPGRCLPRLRITPAAALSSKFRVG